MGPVAGGLHQFPRKSTLRGECFLCAYASASDQDEIHRIVHRGRFNLLVMNAYPYTNGHLLVAPRQHVGELEQVPTEVLAEMVELMRNGVAVLKKVVHCQGINIGINLGRCAGAGLPDHLHIHLVPRWQGDTNFMSVIGNTRVISGSMQDLFERFRAAFAELYPGAHSP